MLSIVKILVYSLIPILFIGCSSRDSSPSENRVDEVYAIDSLAWALKTRGVDIDSVLGVQSIAIEKMHSGVPTNHPVDVLAQMGQFQTVAGNIEKAILYYEEALDSLHAHPELDKESGAIHLFGNLGVFYLQAKLYDRALAMNDSALARAPHATTMRADLFRFRSAIYQDMKDVRKALECYDSAFAHLEDARIPLQGKNNIRAYYSNNRDTYILEAYPDNPDSVNNAVRRIERNIHLAHRDTIASVGALGYGYLLQGKRQHGYRLLNEALTEIGRRGDPEWFDYFADILIKGYADDGMWTELGALYPRYIHRHDSLLKIKTNDAAIGAVVRCELLQKEYRNRILEAELKVQRTHRTLLRVLFVGGVIIGALVLLLLLRRFRVVKRSLEHQQNANKALEEQNTKAESRIQVLETDLKSQRDSNNEILTNPQLITNDKEGQFRRAFNTLYPHVIEALNREYPKVSRNDELMCMLIYLGHSSDEIATFLGISRQSVNTARYRLRQRMDLGKSDSLDDVIGNLR